MVKFLVKEQVRNFAKLLANRLRLVRGQHACCASVVVIIPRIE